LVDKLEKGIGESIKKHLKVLKNRVSAQYCVLGNPLFFVDNLRSMALTTLRHPRSAVILDWQGLPWSVTEAHATPYGFEVYKGYAGTVVPRSSRRFWILTAPLAEHLRTLRGKHAGQLPFLGHKVYEMRKSMGLVKPVIKTMSPKHMWSQQMLALLGTDSDRVIGEKLGISTSAVQSKRASLGIPHFEPWSPEQLALLGQYSDATVAKMLGVGRRAVSAVRLYKKIDSFTARRQAERAKAKAGGQHLGAGTRG
jgi:hypothetical protein